MNFFEYLTAPTIIFMVIVAPLWIIFHYRSKKHASQGLSEHEQQQLEELLVKLDKMTERVATLEEILDAKHGSWRDSVNREKFQ